MQLQSAGAPPGRSRYIDNTRTREASHGKEGEARKSGTERGERRSGETREGRKRRTSVENTYWERERTDRATERKIEKSGWLLVPGRETGRTERQGG